MNQKFQNILNILEQNQNLSAEEKESAIKALKDADKELEITAFKLVRTEKVKKTTAILLEETIEELEQKRKAVEEQAKIIQVENDRKSKELEDARQLQLAMLPRELPKLPHLEIAVYMKTATEVGGDYYDFNVDDNETLTVVVGDATGHGMMSGMMVSIMKSFFIADRNTLELKNFFDSSNKSIKDMQLGRLMMACLGVQITTEKILATNAGMPPLLIYRKQSNIVEEIMINGMPLGAMKNFPYEIREAEILSGDTLLLLSDGLPELKNEKNEQYGYDKVKAEFASIAEKSLDEIVEHLKSSASEWISGIEPDDDITFVVIKIR